MSEQNLINIFKVKALPGQDDLFIVEYSIRGGNKTESYMRLSTCEAQTTSTNEAVATVGRACCDAIEKFKASQKPEKKKKKAAIADPAPEQNGLLEGSED